MKRLCEKVVGGRIVVTTLTGQQLFSEWPDPQLYKLLGYHLGSSRTHIGNSALRLGAAAEEV